MVNHRNLRVKSDILVMINNPAISPFISAHLLGLQNKGLKGVSILMINGKLTTASDILDALPYNETDVKDCSNKVMLLGAESGSVSHNQAYLIKCNKGTIISLPDNLSQIFRRSRSPNALYVDLLGKHNVIDSGNALMTPISQNKHMHIWDAGNLLKSLKKLIFPEGILVTHFQDSVSNRPGNITLDMFKCLSDECGLAIQNITEQKQPDGVTCYSAQLSLPAPA